MNCFVVADVMATLFIGWCNCYSGWWNYHIVWADVLPNYTSWNSHICDSNLIGLICGRWNSHFLWLADVVAMVADVMATGWNVLGRCYCLGGRCYSHRVIIFPYSRWSHVRWTGKSLWSKRKSILLKRKPVISKSFIFNLFNCLCYPLDRLYLDIA